MTDQILTQYLLHQIFEYRDGELYWKVDRADKKVKAGDKAGNPDTGGYLRVCISYKEYRVHRLIFLMNHGFLPKFVDHINGTRTDNRIENLRQATTQQNNRNSKISKKNTSGYKNICWDKSNQSWRVTFVVNGKKKHFGRLKDLQIASKMAQTVRSQLHGDFARNM